MDIKSIRSSMHKFEEAVFLGMEFDVGGIPVLLAGAAKEGKRVQLYFYAAGKDTAKAQEQNMEIEKQRQKGVLTKREELLWQLEGQGLDFDLMGMIRGIKIAGIDYRFQSGNGSGLEEYNLEGRTLVYQFLCHQVPFGFLEQADLSNIQYAVFCLEGEYGELPFTKEDFGQAALLTGPRHFNIPVKHQITAPIGAQADRGYTFYCEGLKREVTYYINDISLVDTLADYEKKQQGWEGNVQEDQELFHNCIKEICPPGMRNLMIEYECDDTFLEIYAKEQLEEKVKINTEPAVAFFLAGRAKKEMGMHGKRMKVCIIQYPVEPDIQEIELEVLGAIVQESLT